MNAGYVSAFAALAGSLIGGLTTFAAAWVTQRQQANVQWLLQEKTRRQELYQQFIEEASKLYVDALIHDQAEIPPLVSLYALINKMRVVSNPGIAERADKFVRIIVDTYALPNKSFQEVRAMMESGALDPLRDFSEACHEELLVSLPKPYNSNIVARGEPISSIEGLRRSFFSFRWPARTIESVSTVDARRRASPASSLRSFGCGMGAHHRLRLHSATSEQSLAPYYLGPRCYWAKAGSTGT